ncbi:hypothetical protein FRC03_012441 [Tulasnella sp. 419]|nr:hypothetical protein FRC03_012441 [Tulasnella sp. 419]
MSSSSRQSPMAAVAQRKRPFNEVDDGQSNDRQRQRQRPQTPPSPSQSHDRDSQDEESDDDGIIVKEEESQDALSLPPRHIPPPLPPHPSAAQSANQRFQPPPPQLTLDTAARKKRRVTISGATHADAAVPLNSSPLSPVVIGFSIPRGQDSVDQVRNALSLKQQQQALIQSRKNAKTSPTHAHPPPTPPITASNSAVSSLPAHLLPFDSSLSPDERRNQRPRTRSRAATSAAAMGHHRGLVSSSSSPALARNHDISRPPLPALSTSTPTAPLPSTTAAPTLDTQTAAISRSANNSRAPSPHNSTLTHSSNLTAPLSSSSWTETHPPPSGMSSLYSRRRGLAIQARDPTSDQQATEKGPMLTPIRTTGFDRDSSSIASFSRTTGTGMPSGLTVQTSAASSVQSSPEKHPAPSIKSISGIKDNLVPTISSSSRTIPPRNPLLALDPVIRSAPIGGRMIHGRPPSFGIGAGDGFSANNSIPVQGNGGAPQGAGSSISVDRHADQGPVNSRLTINPAPAVASTAPNSPTAGIRPSQGHFARNMSPSSNSLPLRQQPLRPQEPVSTTLRTPHVANFPASQIGARDTPDKHAFLNRFGEFYDSLADAKHLKTWLEGQLAKSDTLILSLERAREELEAEKERLKREREALASSNPQKEVEELRSTMRVLQERLRRLEMDPNRHGRTHARTEMEVDTIDEERSQHDVEMANPDGDSSSGPSSSPVIVPRRPAPPSSGRVAGGEFPNSQHGYLHPPPPPQVYRPRSNTSSSIGNPTRDQSSGRDRSGSMSTFQPNNSKTGTSGSGVTLPSIGVLERSAGVSHRDELSGGRPRRDSVNRNLRERRESFSSSGGPGPTLPPPPPPPSFTVPPRYGHSSISPPHAEQSRLPHVLPPLTGANGLNGQGYRHGPSASPQTLPLPLSSSGSSSHESQHAHPSRLGVNSPSRSGLGPSGSPRPHSRTVTDLNNPTHSGTGTRGSPRDMLPRSSPLMGSSRSSPNLPAHHVVAPRASPLSISRRASPTQPYLPPLHPVVARPSPSASPSPPPSPPPPPALSHHRMPLEPGHHTRAPQLGMATAND